MIIKKSEEDDFFDELKDDMSESKRVDEMTRSEYLRNWWKHHNENKREMSRLIRDLLHKHANGDEGMTQELWAKFDAMLDTEPEPQPMDPSYEQNGEDNHFHSAIGNKLLISENYWGAYSLFRINKLRPLGSHCMDMLFEMEDNDG